jgi:peptidoglycan/LPS O-acetylase OafA/YrhL
MVIGEWIRKGSEDFPKQNTIAILDGVRAFACLLVIWYHIYQTPRNLQIWDPQSSTHPLLDSLLYFGKYGVTLFFVLSGFLLFMPYAKALLFEKTWPSLRQFYLRRVFRIVPAYYLSLILIVLLFQQQYLQPQHWNELALFFTFLMDSTYATFKQLNPPFWTLAIDWQYYMLLPLLALGIRLVVWRVKQEYRLPATVACLLTVIAWGLFSRYFGFYYMQHPSETFLVPRSILNGILFLTYNVSGKYLEDFGIGMLLSLCFVYAQHPSISQKVRATLQKLSPWLWGVGLLCLLTLIMWNYNQKYVNTWPLFSNPILFEHYYLLGELCFSLSFGLCILALLFGPTRLKRPFEWFPLRWLGMISFSLYMWHLPLLLVFIQGGQPLLGAWPHLLAYSAYWLWVLVVIIPFCFLFFILVEKPGMKFAERFNRHKAHPATPAAAPSPTLLANDSPGGNELCSQPKATTRDRPYNATNPHPKPVRPC